MDPLDIMYNEYYFFINQPQPSYNNNNNNKNNDSIFSKIKSSFKRLIEYCKNIHS